MPFSNPLERQAAVEDEAVRQFKKLQKTHPDLVKKCGKDNLLSDLRMEVAMSLEDDDETAAMLPQDRQAENLDPDDVEEAAAPQADLSNLLEPESRPTRERPPVAPQETQAEPSRPPTTQPLPTSATPGASPPSPKSGRT